MRSSFLVAVTCFAFSVYGGYPLDSEAINLTQQLSKILQKKGALQRGSLTVTSKVDLITLKGGKDLDALSDDFQKTVKTYLRESLGFWADMDYEEAKSSFPVFLSDIHQTFTAGFQEKLIREYLTETMLELSAKEKASKILNSKKFSAQYVRLSIYDNGAEIIGSDLLLIHPSFTNLAIAIDVKYSDD